MGHRTRAEPHGPSAAPGQCLEPQEAGELADLPSDCKSVLTAGGIDPLKQGDELPPIAVKAATSKEAGPGVPVMTQAQLAALLGTKKLTMQMPERDQSAEGWRFGQNAPFREDLDQAHSLPCCNAAQTLSKVRRTSLANP